MGWDTAAGAVAGSWYTSLGAVVALGWDPWLTVMTKWALYLALVDAFSTCGITNSDP